MAPQSASYLPGRLLLRALHRTFPPAAIALDCDTFTQRNEKFHSCPSFLTTERVEMLLTSVSTRVPEPRHLGRENRCLPPGADPPGGTPPHALCYCPSSACFLKAAARRLADLKFEQMKTGRRHLVSSSHCIMDDILLTRGFLLIAVIGNPGFGVGLFGARQQGSSTASTIIWHAWAKLKRNHCNYQSS